MAEAALVGVMFRIRVINKACFLKDPIFFLKKFLGSVPYASSLLEPKPLKAKM
jgi:hypothetical protein